MVPLAVLSYTFAYLIGLSIGCTAIVLTDLPNGQRRRYQDDCLSSCRGSLVFDYLMRDW